MPIRVLIVDDSAFMRRELTRLFTEDADFEVVGTAVNGAEGIRRARDLAPDPVTLDIEMPEMDGLTALPKIMRESPTHVVMVSSLTTHGSVESLRALRPRPPARPRPGPAAPSHPPPRAALKIRSNQ